jgi:[acyl-carrier-protein] S-malonyltransferase
MQPAVDKLKTALAEVEILTPRIPVVSNVDAKPHFDPEGDRR